jgi:hypothetical protein
MINLYDYIGVKQDSDKLDCLTPVYLMYPDLPKYRYNLDFDYIIKCFKKNFIEVKDPQINDVIIIGNLKKQALHFGVYAGSNKFFHCCNGHGLRVSNLSFYTILKVFRQ